MQKRFQSIIMTLVLCVNLLAFPGLTSKAVGDAFPVIAEDSPAQMALRLQEDQASARLIVMSSEKPPYTYGAEQSYYYRHGGFHIMTYTDREQAVYARNQLTHVYGEENVFLDEKIESSPKYEFACEKAGKKEDLSGTGFPDSEESSEPETEQSTEAESYDSSEPETRQSIEAETEQSAVAESEESTESESEESTEAVSEESSESETEESSESETEESTEAVSEESSEPETEESSEPETEESSEPETEEGPRIVDTSDPYNLMGLDILKERSAQWQQERKITAAILDTGIDTDHPLLDDRISEYSANLLSDRDSDAYEDSNGHGTHVAGIIAKGTSDQVELMAVRIFDDTNSSSMIMLRLGIDYAVECGADVINISITFTPNESHENLIRLIESSLWDAISKGCVICCAAGNFYNNASQYFPANDAYTIAVASIGTGDNDLAASTFSNHGRRIDFTAPGYQIRSSWVGGGSRTQSGTSMSCAFISAAAAMIKLRDPSLSAWETYAIMQDYAVDLGEEGRDNTYGYGYLDLADYGKGIADGRLPHQALTARTDIITDTNSIGTLFDPEIRIVKGDGRLSYKTTDSSVAVIKNGKIKITGNGRCEIIVTAAATDHYQKTERSIYVQVKKVYQTIVMPETVYNVTTLDGPFNLNVVLSPGDGASIRYIYDDAGVITVDSEGNVTPVGEGTAYIYPVASATSRYYETVGDMITVNVKAIKKLSKAVITSVVNTSKGMKFTWKPVEHAAGYYLYRNTGEGFKKIAVINDPSVLVYVDSEAIVNGLSYTFAVLPFNGKIKGPKGVYTYYRVATPAIKSLQAIYSTRSIQVKWSKNSKATGYQIQYSENSNMKPYKLGKATPNTKVTKTISNLTGNVYYVRVRSYLKVDGVNYYSSWSPKKKISLK